ncbi:PhdYeFM domain-containing protein [Streptomyces carminius]|uniref:PhdYeFM domain-containing protein n=1 Tax=Streptomyces carminius TaxID=2665496 RepID=A0A2M8LRQ4_9ACTN|nr:PhdYeFM domain-containing protein [Streptomyces carminius]PJE94626.1 PhdYeFM domain-containing protein [Streptomyces carminius]
MKIIDQHEFRDDFTAVLDAVEAGETYHIARNGMAFAVLRPSRPLPRTRRPTAEELVAEHRELPSADHSAMRQEADGFFGDDRLGDGDPWERHRG